jgi:hypothetical protein
MLVHRLELLRRTFLLNLKQFIKEFNEFTISSGCQRAQRGRAKSDTLVMQIYRWQRCVRLK